MRITHIHIIYSGCSRYYYIVYYYIYLPLAQMFVRFVVQRTRTGSNCASLTGDRCQNGLDRLEIILTVLKVSERNF